MPNLIDAIDPADLFIPVIGSRRLGTTAAPSGPECLTIPTTTSKVTNTAYTMDTEQAGKLSISYLGTGDASVDHKMKVFIREYKKFSECESKDGTATLQYGAVWRATVLIDETDASGNVNFAIVAASATLKNVAVQVSITHEGFEKQEEIDLAAQTAMEDTAGGLNVTSFVKFNQSVEKAIREVVKSPVSAPLQLIGIRPHNMSALLDSVVRTFALSYIARGRGCLDPIKDFPIKNEKIEKIIRETYDQLSSKPCDAGDPITQLSAKQLLNGLKFS